MSDQTHLATPGSGADTLRERYAERQALEAQRQATFLATVKHFGLEPNIMVRLPEGKALTINASDVWAARKKFFVRHELNLHSCWLTVSGDSLGTLFYQWLTQSYSEKYRLLEAREQQQWLKRIAALVVSRHLMETKYALYLQGLPGFADPWVCGMMCHLHVLRTLPAELARMAHHILADPEQKTALIEQFYVATDDHMIRHQHENPEPLPSLPADAILPFALLEQPEEKEESDG